VAEPITFKIVALAIIGGILPAVVWLWFWLKQDARRPEPFGLITLSFLAGIVGVVVTFPIQKFAMNYSHSLDFLPFWTTTATAMIFLLAGIEELVKYGAARLVAFRTRYFDEPIDAMVYLITVALGFAAMENFFYILNILGNGGIFEAAINAQMRFIGATLLHVVSSASIGFFIGLSYYRKKKRKLLYLTGGILTAILLHGVFNLFIIKANTAMDILHIFFFFWIVVIILILLFEKIKRIKRPLI